MNSHQLFRKYAHTISIATLLSIFLSGNIEKLATASEVAPEEPLSLEDSQRTQKFLAERLQNLASTDLAKRLSNAEQIINADPKAAEVYIQALAEPLPENRYPMIALRGMVWAIWGQFPNPLYPKGRAPMWYVRHQTTQVPKKPGQIPAAMDPSAKPATEHDPDQVDWVKALATVDEKEWKAAMVDLVKEKAMPLSSVKGMATFSAIRSQMLFRVALLRALGEMGSKGRMQVVSPVFDFAFMYQGIFRDECGRTLRNMGEFAVPELSRIAYTRYSLKDKEAKKNGLVVVKDKDRDARIRYANFQLERLDRQSAKKALRSAPSQEMQVELLNIYAEVQYRGAVEAVLSYINDSSTAIRNAARVAWMRYVEGPAPDPSPARYRKHPGGVIDGHTTPDYANFRELAEALIRKRLDALKLLKGQPNLKAMTTQLFAYYDDEREHQLDRLYDQAKTAQDQGQLKQATDLYQWILAQQPKYPKRIDMADAFYQQGEALAQQGEQTNNQKLISQALGYLHKSLLLDPRHPKHARIEARIHYLDGKQSQALGGDGLSDFQMAVQADPSYAEAKQELDHKKH